MIWRLTIDLLQLVLGYVDISLLLTHKIYVWYYSQFSLTIYHFHINYSLVTFLNFRIQSLSLNSTVLTNAQKFNLHAIVISLLSLVPLVVNIQPLLDYAGKLISARKREAPHLLPNLQEQYPANCEVANKLPHLLVDQMALCEYVKSGGLDPTRLAQTSPYGAGGPGAVVGNSRRSWVEMSARGSVVEIGNVAEVDSVSSSPGVQRVSSFYQVLKQLKIREI